MKNFYNSIGFIIAFMLACVCVSAILGEKFLNKFLVLVLVSQILLNSNEFIEIFNTFTTKTINDTKQNDNKKDMKIADDVIIRT